MNNEEVENLSEQLRIARNEVKKLREVATQQASALERAEETVRQYIAGDSVGLESGVLQDYLIVMLADKARQALDKSFGERLKAQSLELSESIQEEVRTLEALKSQRQSELSALQDFIAARKQALLNEAISGTGSRDPGAQNGE